MDEITDTIMHNYKAMKFGTKMWSIEVFSWTKLTSELLVRTFLWENFKIFEVHYLLYSKGAQEASFVLKL